MRLPPFVLFILVPAYLSAQAPAPLGKPLRIIDSIPGPESVAIGPDGAWYVSSFGKFDNGADGAVYRVDPEKGTRKVYAPGLKDPCGLVFLGKTLWAADRDGVYRVTPGKAELVYSARSFPRPRRHAVRRRVPDRRVVGDRWSRLLARDRTGAGLA